MNACRKSNEASLVEFALRQFPACKGMMKGLTKVDVARIRGLPPLLRHW